MGIINDNFLLKSETARQFYNDYAKDMPIIDYHYHINPKEIAEDRKFNNITEFGSMATIINGVLFVQMG